MHDHGGAGNLGQKRVAPGGDGCRGTLVTEGTDDSEMAGLDGGSLLHQQAFGELTGWKPHGIRSRPEEPTQPFRLGGRLEAAGENGPVRECRPRLSPVGGGEQEGSRELTRSDDGDGALGQEGKVAQNFHAWGGLNEPIGDRHAHGALPPEAVYRCFGLEGVLG